MATPRSAVCSFELQPVVKASGCTQVNGSVPWAERQLAQTSAVVALCTERVAAIRRVNLQRRIVLP